MASNTKNPYSYDCEAVEVPSCNTTRVRFVSSLDIWCCEDCETWLVQG